MVESNGVRTGRSWKRPVIGITGIAFALSGLAAAQERADIIIRNGLIVTVEGRMEADVRIRGEQVAEIGPDLVARLMAQDWPGNARALTSVAMRVAMGLDPGLSEAATGDELGLAEQLARVERSLLIEALRRHEGHATRTAEALGGSRGWQGH